MEGLVLELVEFADGAFRGEAGTPPKQLAHFWDWFSEINRWRRVNREDMGPEPITLDIVQAWAGTSGNELDEFSLEVLNRLEAAYWMSRHPKQEAGSITKQFATLAEKPIRTIPMNPKRK